MTSLGEVTHTHKESLVRRFATVALLSTVQTSFRFSPNSSVSRMANDCLRKSDPSRLSPCQGPGQTIHFKTGTREENLSSSLSPSLSYHAF